MQGTAILLGNVAQPVRARGIPTGPRVGRSTRAFSIALLNFKSAPDGTPRVSALPLHLGRTRG